MTQTLKETVFYLDKGKILLPYKKDDHIENVGRFIGFKQSNGEIISFCSPTSINHEILIKALKNLVPDKINGEPIFIGVAYNGCILKDEICFMKDEVVFLNEINRRLVTPKEYWDMPVEIFGFSIVSVNK